MVKVAVTVERSSPGGQWKLTAGPDEDVAGQIAKARGESVARGGGDGCLLVISTEGIEKRWKIGPASAAPKAKVK